MTSVSDGQVLQTPAPSTAAAALASNLAIKSSIALGCWTKSRYYQQLAGKSCCWYECSYAFSLSLQTNLPAATSQNVSIRLNRGHGKLLKKIFTSPYAETETANTMYDHSNIGADADTAKLPPSTPN